MGLSDWIPLGLTGIGAAIMYGKHSNRLTVVESKTAGIEGLKTDVALIKQDVQYIKERITNKRPLI
jgi:hypothetical protein